MTRLYFDVHVPAAIRDQLRRRGVDVLTAQDDGSARLDDADLLDRASALGRVLFTQDIRFKALAQQRQADGVFFTGLVFGHQMHTSIGHIVRDLELISLATEPSEWIGRVEVLPLR